MVRKAGFAHINECVSIQMFFILRKSRWLFNAGMLGGGHALENAGHHIRRIPIVGNTLAKLSVPAVICSRRLIAAVHGLVNGVISTIEGIAYGLSAALSRSGNGLKACAVGKFGIAWHEIKAAAVLVLRFPFDAALMATATTISTIQTTLFLEHMGRRLSCREVSMLKHVFGNSVDYSAVTIKEGFAGVASTRGSLKEGV